MGAAAMLTPELRWPTTATTPASTRVWATFMPSSALALSSTATTSSLTGFAVDLEAFGVELVDGELNAVLHVIAQGRERAGHGLGDADLDGVGDAVAAGQNESAGQ